jgi:UDP-N-acetylglucosamine:LPS N-acetylglucosamine transferase
MTGLETDEQHVEKHPGSSRIRAIKVCLTASTGGHLSELETLSDIFRSRETFLVTTLSPYSDSVMPMIRRRYVRRIARNPANLVVNFFQSVRILLQERPDTIVSTGAGDCVFLMLVGASLGIPVVFAESMARVSTMSLTGRMVHRWSTLILVQWPSLLDRYPNAVLISPSIQPKKPVYALPALSAIVVLTGTSEHGFERLLRGLDQLIEGGKLPSSVFAQIGHSEYVPRNYRYVRFLPHSQLIDAIRASDLVITHDGAGSMREALGLGKRTLVFPRRSRSGELAYQSRSELAVHLAALGWIEIVEDPLDIPRVLANRPAGNHSPHGEDGRDPKQVLAEFLNFLGFDATASRKGPS